MKTLPLPKSQQGYTLLQSLVGMVLSLWVIAASFAAFAWMQNNHQHMQARFALHERLHTGLSLIQQRINRAGAPTLLIDTQSKVSLLSPTLHLQGSDNSLSLMHHTRLTPADCLGHQATTLTWIQDDFIRSSRRELSCKDRLRSNTSYQALVDNIDQIGFLYAEVLPSAEPRMQWRSAATVSNWQAIRGVRSCLQTKRHGSGSLPSSPACTTGVPLQPPALSWQGVSFLRHIPP